MTISNREDFLEQLARLEKKPEYSDGLHPLRKAVFQIKNLESAHIIDYSKKPTLVLHYNIDGNTYTTLSYIVAGEVEADIAYSLETKLLRMMHIKHLEEQRRQVEQDKIRLEREHMARMEAVIERGLRLDQEIAEAWKK